jgi:hypothetical protein
MFVYGFLLGFLTGAAIMGAWVLAEMRRERRRPWWRS